MNVTKKQISIGVATVMITAAILLSAGVYSGFLWDGDAALVSKELAGDPAPLTDSSTPHDVDSAIINMGE